MGLLVCTADEPCKGDEGALLESLHTGPLQPYYATDSVQCCRLHYSNYGVGPNSVHVHFGTWDIHFGTCPIRYTTNFEVHFRYTTSIRRPLRYDMIYHHFTPHKLCTLSRVFRAHSRYGRRLAADILPVCRHRQVDKNVSSAMVGICKCFRSPVKPSSAVVIFVPTNLPAFAVLCENADENMPSPATVIMFTLITLYLLPPQSQGSQHYELRQRSDNFALPSRTGHHNEDCTVCNIG